MVKSSRDGLLLLMKPALEQNAVRVVGVVGEKEEEVVGVVVENEVVGVVVGNGPFNIRSTRLIHSDVNSFAS
jgi:hypothetical protein